MNLYPSTSASLDSSGDPIDVQPYPCPIAQAPLIPFSHPLSTHNNHQLHHPQHPQQSSQYFSQNAHQQSYLDSDMARRDHLAQSNEHQSAHTNIPAGVTAAIPAAAAASVTATAPLPVSIAGKPPTPTPTPPPHVTAAHWNHLHPTYPTETKSGLSNIATPQMPPNFHPQPALACPTGDSRTFSSDFSNSSTPLPELVDSIHNEIVDHFEEAFPDKFPALMQGHRNQNQRVPQQQQQQQKQRQQQLQLQKQRQQQLQLQMQMQQPPHNPHSALEVPEQQKYYPNSFVNPMNTSFNIEPSTTQYGNFCHELDVVEATFSPHGAFTTSEMPVSLPVTSFYIPHQQYQQQPRTKFLPHTHLHPSGAPASDIMYGIPDASGALDWSLASSKDLLAAARAAAAAAAAIAANATKSLNESHILFHPLGQQQQQQIVQKFQPQPLAPKPATPQTPNQPRSKLSAAQVEGAPKTFVAHQQEVNRGSGIVDTCRRGSLSNMGDMKLEDATEILPAEDAEVRKSMRPERSRQSSAASRERMKHHIKEFESRMTTLSRENAQLQVGQLQNSHEEIAKDPKLVSENNELKREISVKKMMIANISRELKEKVALRDMEIKNLSRLLERYKMSESS